MFLLQFWLYLVYSVLGVQTSEEKSLIANEFVVSNPILKPETSNCLRFGINTNQTPGREDNLTDVAGLSDTDNREGIFFLACVHSYPVAVLSPKQSTIAFLQIILPV